MSLFSRFWRYISEQGLDSSESVLTQNRIRLLNRTAVVAIFLTSFYTTVNLTHGQVLIAATQGTLIAMFLVAIAINRFGMFNTALVFFIAAVNISILSQCWLLGEESGDHYYFFLTALFPLLITDKKSYTYGLFAMAVVGFLLSKAFFLYSNPIFYPIYGQVFQISNLLATITLLFLGIKLFKDQSKSLQTSMQKNGEALTLQSQELQKQRDQLLTLNETLKGQNEKIEQHRVRLEKSFWDIQMLSEIGKNITAKLSIPEIIDAIYEDLSLVMSVDVFILGIWDQRQERLQVTELHSNYEKKYATYMRDDEETFGVFAFNKMQHYVLNDFAEDAIEHNPNYRAIEEKPPVAAIYVPLQINEEPFGMICVTSQEPNVYSEHHLNILQNLAVFITNSLENARIYSQLEVQKMEIERQNKDITDSITYASRIQKAVLDSSETIISQFSDAFIYYQPKDIVSGDFYWFHRRDHRRYVVVADCTGHGVAGAFLTIMGVDFLNEIVIADPEEKKPHRILEELNDKLHWMTYRQTYKSITDGMDLAVVIFDEKKNIVEFSGAKSNIWYVRNEEIHQIRGSHFSIGRGNSETRSQFETVTLPLEQNDKYYLLSDGFQDQFGGPRHKKYLRKKLREFILSISHLPMSEQKIQLAQELFRWMGDHPQTDDILVVGLEL